ncbi:hypothetical protein FOA52_012492 [Chlamydomonas sp. UWO 241]|nr:hypothetical protein FOA52_012492 [Chlamydomonas sp. UWO 241]
MLRASPLLLGALALACFAAATPGPRSRVLLEEAAPASPEGIGGAGVVNQFVSTAKACVDGCGTVGNCNLETGNCECPWGRTGPGCAVDLLPHCYSSAERVMPSCGTYVPKSCQCYRECFDFLCRTNRTGPRHGGIECTHERGQTIGEGRCFVLPGKPLEEQHSFIPRNGTDEVEWYKAPFEMDLFTPAPSVRYPRLDKDMEWACWNPWSRRDSMVYAVPLDTCPGSCGNGRGSCVTQPTEGRTYCICRTGFKGEACEHLDDESCWFSPNCSGHGTCANGFCNCEAGRWGIDCSRSKAYTLQPGSRVVPTRTALRVYMYDLPSSVVFPGEFDDGMLGRDPMYTGYEYFLQSFLTDWSVRTENPYEANMFFVPAMLYFYVANVRDPVPHLKHIVTHLQTEYPFWNRTLGKDHFWWMAGDHGACGLYAQEALMDHPIKISHFGLSGPGVEFHHDVDQDYACVRPERDIVAPPVADLKFVREGSTLALYEHVLANNGSDGRNRTMLFFFAGGVSHGDNKVSGGARQAIFKVLKAHENDATYSDILFKDGRVDNYEQMFLDSKFCVAPYGYGWGLRLAIAVVHGCVPIITQAHTWQPFEELLPYEEFSVRISNADLPNIVPILRAYSQEQIDRMRLALAKHWGAFVWPAGQGGLAYNYTIAALKRRVYHHAAEYYRHH